MRLWAFACGCQPKDRNKVLEPVLADLRATFLDVLPQNYDDATLDTIKPRSRRRSPEPQSSLAFVWIALKAQRTGWAERWRRREATGDMVIVRYADDTVVGFQHEADTRRFWVAVRTRLAEFALSLHPEKTRLIEFGRFAAVARAQRGLGKPETFNFLGFTLICGTSRSGKFLLRRKTRRDRMRAKLREVKEELRRRMHQPIPEQGRWLRQVVTGFFAYHAVPTNSAALGTFRYYVVNLWRRSLKRRSQKDHITWPRITKLADDWLPQPRILHPWPQKRFAVRYPRWEPYAGVPHVRICAGGASLPRSDYRSGVVGVRRIEACHVLLLSCLGDVLITADRRPDLGVAEVDIGGLEARIRGDHRALRALLSRHALIEQSARRGIGPMNTILSSTTTHIRT